MAGLEKNKVYRATIEGYSSEGLGIARIDGQVVFVHRAVRGEVCDILVLKVLKNAAFGKVVGVEQPSAHRREPDCPYYGQCGGCDFRHMDYQEELQAKRQRVQDALQRLGGSAVSVEEIIEKSDAVLIESDVWDLTKYAKMCVDAGKHIHMDKPAGGTLEDDGKCFGKT